MDWAGVERGAKILVGLKRGCEGSAQEPAADQQIETRALAGRDLISKLIDLECAPSSAAVPPARACRTIVPAANLPVPWDSLPPPGAALRRGPRPVSAGFPQRVRFRYAV